MIDTLINGRWILSLPEHRAARKEWGSWVDGLGHDRLGWESVRLASIHDRMMAAVDQWHRRDGFALGTAGRETRSPRPVIVDVGAEEGDMSALYSKWGCDVILVEPNPLVWPNIKAIWDANHLRPPLANFVGFCAEWSNLAPYRDSVGGRGLLGKDGWPFCARGPIIADHGFRHLAQQADETPSITLDDLVSDRRVDAITMDVEGAELHVLAGAAKVLERERPLVWVSVHLDYEWNDQHYEGVRPEKIVEFMDGFDYRATLLAEELHEDHWLFIP